MLLFLPNQAYVIDLPVVKRLPEGQLLSAHKNSKSVHSGVFQLILSKFLVALLQHRNNIFLMCLIDIDRSPDDVTTQSILLEEQITVMHHVFLSFPK